VRAEKCRFSFNYCGKITVLFSALLISCNPGWEERPAENADAVIFAVFDVGEGLAQAVVSGNRAVLFDMGLPEEYPKWKEQFEGLGSPFVEAIVISHDHLDHWGGLQMLDTGLAWTGIVIVTPYEDTAFMRNSVPQWRDWIRFRTIARGDTLALLDGVALRCLWPPDTAGDSLFVNDSLKNRHSMVFLVKNGLTGALITSDIDTCAEQELSLLENSGLAAAIMVVPHHGSAGSLDPVFYGYVKPFSAFISCGSNNQYGHPSNQVLLWLSQTGIAAYQTSLEGEIIAQSNGYFYDVLNRQN
jgi:beta-lactamase superfamily II metal-dependent hydrolase